MSSQVHVMDQMFVFLKFMYWSPNPQCDGKREVIRFSWGHEAEALWWYWCPHKKMEGGQGTLFLSAIWGHSKKLAIYKLEEDTHQGMKSTITLTLDFPAYRTAKNKFCCLNHPIYGIFLWPVFSYDLYFPGLTKALCFGICPLLLWKYL